ncbi:hypothetical protein HDV00_001779 [Rhizophlyctis rosea]|nr:hypothetical protein HDV00_001779 [Rhizophlyctis rosea]
MQNVATEELLRLLLVDRLFNLHVKKFRSCVAEAQAIAFTAAVKATKASDGTMTIPSYILKNPFFNVPANFPILYDVVDRDDKQAIEDFLIHFLPALTYTTTPMDPKVLPGNVIVDNVAMSCEHCTMPDEKGNNIVVLKNPKCSDGQSVRQYDFIVRFPDDDDCHCIGVNCKVHHLATPVGVSTALTINAEQYRGLVQ